MTDVGAAAPLCLPPKPLDRSPAFRLPAGTVDAHFHVVAADAPLAVPRNYTPPPSTLHDWLTFAAAVGIDRGVIVQPSVYGRDNSALLSALAALPERLRGVVVVDPGISDEDLSRLARSGVRGIRINTRNPGGLTLDAVPALARRIASLGWHIQLLVDESSLAALAALATTCEVPLVIDHMALVPVDDPVRLMAALAGLTRLLDSGNCYVKLSAPYRLTDVRGWESIRAPVEALVKANPDRLFWGSDWPHTELFRLAPDDADLIDSIHDWLQDDHTRQKVFVSNPNRFYWAD
jgi:predicted TIM-barrel fold metal-dependent hydrolase